MNFFLKKIYVLVSEFYRGWISVKEFFSGKRAEVYFLTNLQRESEKAFLGKDFIAHNKYFSYSLKVRLGKISGQILAINSIAKDLVKGHNPRAREIAKRQVSTAIHDAVGRGAKVILFGASTKRLLSVNELDEMQKCYPQVTLTIGDCGTVLMLLKDVRRAIREQRISRSDKILLTGPNGFLGAIVKKFLLSEGFSNVVCVSSQTGTNPFDEIGGEFKLFIACSHHYRSRPITADLRKIAHSEGLYVVDVCRPHAILKKVYFSTQKSGIKIVRQDAGNTYNSDLRWEFPLIAKVALGQLDLSLSRLFGCFSEALALGNFSREELSQFDFLSVNKNAGAFVENAFEKTGFEVSPICNYGEGILLRSKKKREILPAIGKLAKEAGAFASFL